MRKTKTFDEILFICQHRPPKMHQRANEAKNPKVRLIDRFVEFDLCAISGAFQLHRSNMIQYFSKTFFSKKECLGLLREMNRFKESGLLRLTSTGKCKVIHSVGNISTYCQ